MGPFTCVREAAVLVFVGRFNPALYQPRWLGKVGLLPEKDTEDAVISAIVPDFAGFKVGDWLSFECTPDRLQITTDKVENSLLLRDFAVSFFKVLEHTPVQQAGINRAMHFRLSAADDRMQLGKRLASPVEWPSLVEDPLMISLTMQTKRHGSKNVLSVTVQPSKLAEIEQPLGVFVTTNENYVPEGDEEPSTFIDRIGADFEIAFPFGRDVATALLKGERHG